jgi:hypothetical protein
MPLAYMVAILETLIAVALVAGFAASSPTARPSRSAC